MKSILKTLAASFLLAYCAATLHASIQIGDHIQVGNGAGTPGGTFYVNDLNDTDQIYDFDSFCVEIEEHINFSSTYEIENIDTATNQTGKTLSSYTAWLYTQYLGGTLSNFNYAPTTNYEAKVEANTLQMAIWEGMGYTKNPDSSGGWYDGGVGYIKPAWYDKYEPLTTDNGWFNEFDNDNSWSEESVGNVRIMNLRKVNYDGSLGQHAQDLLVMMPPNPNLQSHAPEPTSVLVWTLLAAAAGYVSRYRS